MGLALTRFSFQVLRCIGMRDGQFADLAWDEAVVEYTLSHVPMGLPPFFKVGPRG